MSHHLYKPYVSGDQSSPKGQYGQSEKDLWRVPHHSHPGSSFSSSEVSSAASYNLGGTMPPTSLQPESYKPEQRRAGLNEDIERSAVHFHISIARERTRHQPVGNNVYMSSPQRDKFLSSSEEMTSHSASSTFQRHGLTDSDSSSLDWLSICKTPIREDSSKISQTSASSSYRNSGGRQFYASSERQRDVQGIPGLGDDNDPVPGKTMPPKKSQQPKYTPEVAVNILQKFGLGKEDLKYLLSYPEDQITSDNLPLILRHIRVQKGKQTSKSDQSKSVTEARSLPWQPKEKEKSEQQSPYQKAQQELENQPMPFQMGQAFQPHFFPASNSVPPPYFIPGFVAPPAKPQLTPGLIGYPPPPPSWQFLAKGPVYSGPTQAMMNDYASTPPVMFPHVCSLCNIVCPGMRDWLPHQNRRCHLENCKLLRKRFPYWDGNADYFLGASGKDVEPSPSTSAQSWSYAHENIQHERRSRSHSPRRYSRSKRRRETSSSSSRSRSRSHSPRWRPSSSGSDSGSHSPSYSPRRHRTKRTSRSRSRNCSRSPRRQHGSKSKRVKRSSRSGSKYSSRRSRSPFTSHRSRSRSYERRSSSRREEEKRFSPKRSSERRPVPGRSTSQRRTSSSAERQLETSEIHSQSKRFDLDTAAVTLSPEVARKESRSSSSSSKKLPKVRNDLSDSEEEELPPPTMVKLTGVHQTLTQSKVLAAVEILGKTTSVILYRSKEEANVDFEKEEDAEKLRSLKNLFIDGIPVKIVKEKPAAAVKKTPPTSTEKQMKPPRQKSAELILSTPKTDESTSRGKIETPVSSSPAVNQTKAVSETRSRDSAEKVKVAASKPTAAEGKRKLTSVYSEDPVTCLTVGEMVETYLYPGSLKCFKTKGKCLKQSFNVTLVLITRLPKYTDGLYKEKDIADLLHPFGFQHGRDPIYVIPQQGLAIATMPSAKSVQKLVKMTWKGIRFNCSGLRLRPLSDKISMTWFGFYQYLMSRMLFKVTDDGTRTVYIEDISVEDTRELREALRQVVSVKNFLPLLNKVYVEFDSMENADLLGLSYNHSKKDCMHSVHRLGLPRIPKVAPTGKCDVSLGNTPPFWITMKARPYMFPTFSPWCSNPTYLTANTLEDIKSASTRGADVFRTVMLTGFKDGEYTHADVAELVWPFLSGKNLCTLLTSVIFLPLQKRAFVNFSSWLGCYNFVASHIKNRVSLKGRPLHVHFVLQEMDFKCKEVTVYRNMMKLSNCEIPNQKSLESRMLSVEISVASQDFITMIMGAVASIASFVNYLPFANRIYIEMSSSSDVTKVLEGFYNILPFEFRSKIDRIESLSSLQLRLRNFGHMPVHLEPVKATADSEANLQTSAPATASSNRAECCVPYKSCTDQKQDKEKSGGLVPNTSTGAAVLPRGMIAWTHSNNQEAKHTEAASDHESADGPTAETSSEVDPNPLGQEIKITNEAQSLDTDFKDETTQEVKKLLNKEKDDDGKNDEILDSLKDQTFEVCPEECSDIEMSLKNESFTAPQKSKVDRIQFKSSNESTDEDAADKNLGLDINDKQIPQRNGSSGGQEEDTISSENVNKVRESDQNMEDESKGCPDSDKSAEVDAADINDKQTSKSVKDRERMVQGEEKGDSEESSNISEDAGQISNDNKMCVEDGNSKDASEVLNEQEVLETLESLDDQIITEDDRLKLETDQVSKADVGSTEEDEDVPQVTDSVEVEQTTTATESVAVIKEECTKKDNVRPEGDVRPTRSGLRTRTARSEEKPAEKQDTVKHEIQTRNITGKDKKTDEETQETVCELEEHISTTKRSARRRTTRGSKEETVSTVLDCVEDEAAADEPTVTTRLTRGRREKLKKDAEKEKSGKEETVTGRKNTPAREKSTEREDKAPPLGDISEEEAAEDVGPATPVKSRRGRPKKDIKTTQNLKKEDLFGKERTGGCQEENLLHLADEGEEDHDAASAADRNVKEMEMLKADEPATESTSEAESQEEKKEKADSVQPEMIPNVYKAGSAEEDEAGKTSVSAKHKHDDSSEEKTSFMTVDEAEPTRKRGRPRKKTRNAPVRKSARGKTGSIDGGNESPPPDSLDSSMLDKDNVQPEIQETNMEAENQPETLEGCSMEVVEGF